MGRKFFKRKSRSRKVLSVTEQPPAQDLPSGPVSLKLDCTTLINHLSIVQKSLSHCYSESTKNDLTLLRLPLSSNPNVNTELHHEKKSRKKVSSPILRRRKRKKKIDAEVETTQTQEEDWYVLVANTPYAASAQLVSVPTKTPISIITPDVSRCTPISIWTSPKPECSEYSIDKNNDEAVELINCKPSILISEPPVGQLGIESECIKVAVVLGTNNSRVLSVQLSIHAHSLTAKPLELPALGQLRYAMYKAVGENIIEPLPLEKDDVAIKGSTRDIGGKQNASDSQSKGQQSDTISDTSSQPNSVKSSIAGSMQGSRSLNMSRQGSSVALAGIGEDTSSAIESSKDLSHKEVEEEKVPFCPEGGVKSLYCYYNYNSQLKKKKTGVIFDGIDNFIWVGYGDGTIVRLPHWFFFPLELEDIELNQFLNHACQNSVANAKVICSPNDIQDHFHYVLPLPVFFPTLLSQPHEAIMQGPKSFTEDESSEEEDYVMHLDDFYEAVSYNDQSSHTAGDILSSLNFYTNEDQLFSKTHLDESNSAGVDMGRRLEAFQTLIKGGSNLIGETAAMAKGMFGGVIGSVWGRSRKVKDKGEKVQGMEIGAIEVKDNDESVIGAESVVANAFFPQLHSTPTSVPLGSSIFDNPRCIIHASIEPGGMLLACADNLGRVQLIDLSTKQVIRLWKGFRDASCYWIQSDHSLGDYHSQIVTYLVIHARQRKVIEIFRTRHGPRVGKFNVDSNDARVVQCVVTSKNKESCTKCFLVQTKGKKFVAEDLIPDDPELPALSQPFISSTTSKGVDTIPDQTQQDETLQLQLLKQQLGSETHVPSDLDSVFAALEEITAISDMSKALDLLAVATHLEDGMGVEDSSFHAEALAHVKQQLDIVSVDKAINVSSNLHLKELANKIELHSQIISSYDELNKFETECSSFDEEGDVERSSSERSLWAPEALSWIKTHEEVTERGIDCDLQRLEEEPVVFSVFAKACLQDIQGSKPLPKNDKGERKLFLCDSTRDRKVILMHVFRPLLKDVFSYKTTQKIFKQMGLIDEHNALLKYFGEWFMSLPVMTAANVSIDRLSVTIRWLQETIQHSTKREDYDVPKDERKNVLLEVLYKFCSESTDLPRAFLLSIACFEAISEAVKKLEEESYGEISREESVKPWAELLRKIRMCLLISLRLHNNVADSGAFPITVANIDCGKNFSVYEWIARDEISLTHKHGEITAMEDACWSSALAFNPSDVDGDELFRWKMVQLSCRQHRGCRNKDNFCPSDHKEPGPLLLFMKHYDNATKLAAHRFVILANMWGREPKSLHLLKDAVSSLRSLAMDMEGDSYVNLLVAVIIEVWQGHLRPVYRAILFGFDDVPEISEQVMEPLCLDVSWFHSLIKISLGIIDIFERAISGELFNADDVIPDDTGYNSQEWPPLQEDVAIQNYLTRIRSISKSSIAMHKGVLLAMQLSEDLSMLPMCAPELESLFLKVSFYQEFHPSFATNEYQHEFITNALKQHATNATGPTIHHNDIDSIIALGRTWGLDKGQILTKFVLIMYEIEKDDIVEDFVCSTERLLDMSSFITGGIELSCVRLNAAVMVLKKTKHHRSLLAMLDADTCQWVKEKAETVLEERPELQEIGRNGKLPSLERTNALILQMVRMTVSNQRETHALNIMSGTLLKALEQFDNGVFTS